MIVKFYKLPLPKSKEDANLNSKASIKNIFNQNFWIWADAHPLQSKRNSWQIRSSSLKFSWRSVLFLGRSSENTVWKGGGDVSSLRPVSCEFSPH